MPSLLAGNFKLCENKKGTGKIPCQINYIKKTERKLHKIRFINEFY
jgi:hypothetical protein